MPRKSKPQGPRCTCGRCNACDCRRYYWRRVGRPKPELELCDCMICPTCRAREKYPQRGKR
jgi:hypothetical protein